MFKSIKQLLSTWLLETNLHYSTITNKKTHEVYVIHGDKMSYIPCLGTDRNDADVLLVKDVLTDTSIPEEVRKHLSTLRLENTNKLHSTFEFVKSKLTTHYHIRNVVMTLSFVHHRDNIVQIVDLDCVAKYWFHFSKHMRTQDYAKLIKYAILNQCSTEVLMMNIEGMSSIYYAHSLDIINKCPSYSEVLWINYVYGASIECTENEVLYKDASKYLNVDGIIPLLLKLNKMNSLYQTYTFLNNAFDYIPVPLMRKVFHELTEFNVNLKDYLYSNLDMKFLKHLPAVDDISMRGIIRHKISLGEDVYDLVENKDKLNYVLDIEVLQCLILINDINSIKAFIRNKGKNIQSNEVDCIIRTRDVDLINELQSSRTDVILFQLMNQQKLKV